MASFTDQGVQDWCTNLTGLHSLQAAAIQVPTARLLVMGNTKSMNGLAAIFNGCAASQGELSLCDPGGNAFHDNTLSYIDQYFAEFDLVSGEHLWSTLYGGTSDEMAELGLLNYTNAHFQLFEVYRNMDLVSDQDGNFYALGLTGQAVATSPANFPTYPAWGFYNKAFDPNIGNDQSEVTLACFLADRSLFWSSVFGSGFDHIGTPTDWQADFKFLNLGCDIGHNLALVENTALYWAGSTGGLNYHHECPYPFPSGNSYCETPLVGSPLLGLDAYHGFVARMDLTSLTVNIQENGSTHPREVFAIYDPHADLVTIGWMEDVDEQREVSLIDALGREAGLFKLHNGGSFSMGGLSNGMYVVRTALSSGRSATVKFIKW